MKVSETDLPGCLVIEPRVFGDDRGFFYESWNQPRFAALGIDWPVAEPLLSGKDGNAPLRADIDPAQLPPYLA